MRQPVQKYAAIIFWILAILDLVGIAARIEWLHMIVKPLLAPALLLLLLKTHSSTPGKNLIVIGLLFSWLGDEIGRAHV